MISNYRFERNTEQILKKKKQTENNKNCFVCFNSLLKFFKTFHWPKRVLFSKLKYVHVHLFQSNNSRSTVLKNYTESIIKRKYC